jgi:hypothetical protein
MKTLVFGLLIVAGIVMLSFVAPHVYKINKEFLSTGKMPIKSTLKYVGAGILAMLCFVIFAILLLVFLK